MLPFAAVVSTGGADMAAHVRGSMRIPEPQTSRPPPWWREMVLDRLHTLTQQCSFVDLFCVKFGLVPISEQCHIYIFHVMLFSGNRYAVGAFLLSKKDCLFSFMNLFHFKWNVLFLQTKKRALQRKHWFLMLRKHRWCNQHTRTHPIYFRTREKK